MRFCATAPGARVASHESCPNLCHLDRRRRSFATEAERRDPDNVSLAVLMQGVLSKLPRFAVLLARHPPAHYLMLCTRPQSESRVSGTNESSPVRFLSARAR